MRTYKLACIIINTFLFSWVNTNAQEQFNSGLILISQEEFDSLPSADITPRGFVEPPTKWDLASSFPTPGDQTTYQGSCVGWTLGYALKSFHERREENNSGITHSPSYIYNQVLRKSLPCKTGIKFTEAFELVRNKGSATIEEFPYKSGDCRTLPSDIVIKSAKKYNILAWNVIYKHKQGRTIDIERIKKEIYLDNPVAVAVLIDRKFHNNTYGKRNLPRPYIWDNVDFDCSNCFHAMLCVGYDDDIKAFKLMNSYGTTFGDNGFGWISYDAFKKTVREAYVAIDNQNDLDEYPIARKKVGRSPEGSVESFFRDDIFSDDFYRYDSWLKEGYFRNVNNDLKISLIYLNRRNQEAIFRVYDIRSKNRMLGSYKLNLGDSFSLKYEDIEIYLSFDRIGKAGVNFFKPAAFYSFGIKKITRN